MKKVKHLKKLFDTFKWTSKFSETTFDANSKSKIVVSVHCACANKDKVSNPSVTNLIFYFIPNVVYLQRLYGVKITKTKRSKISRLGTFKVLTNDIPTIAVNCSFIWKPDIDDVVGNKYCIQITETPFAAYFLASHKIGPALICLKISAWIT